MHRVMPRTCPRSAQRARTEARRSQGNFLSPGETTLHIDHQDFRFLRKYLERDQKPVPLPEVVYSEEGVQGSSPAIGVKHVKDAPSGSPTKRQAVVAMSPIADDGGATSGSRKISWTRTEDLAILTLERRLGPQWDRIAAQLPGRTTEAVRGRFHRLQRSPLVETQEGRTVLAGLEATCTRVLSEMSELPPQPAGGGAAGGHPASSPEQPLRTPLPRTGPPPRPAVLVDTASPAAAVESDYVNDALAQLAGTDNAELPLGLTSPGLTFDVESFVSAVSGAFNSLASPVSRPTGRPPSGPDTEPDHSAGLPLKLVSGAMFVVAVIAIGRLVRPTASWARSS
jgi:hypothetical protein